MAPSSTILVLQAISVLVVVVIVIGSLESVTSIEVKSWVCNTVKYPAHDIKRIFVGDLLEELVESELPISEDRSLGTSIPKNLPLIYAYANCTPGYLNQDDYCLPCLKMAKRNLLHNCPHSIGAKVYLDICYMRPTGSDCIQFGPELTDHSAKLVDMMAPLLATFVMTIILAVIGFQQYGGHVGALEINTLRCSSTNYAASDPARDILEQVLETLIEVIDPFWAVPAVKTSTPPEHPVVYAYANCSPDYFPCHTCLNIAKGDLVLQCPDRTGGQVQLNHCYMRYEAYYF
ncbi:hypothetical protein LINGRAHAP2_LOCUS36443 [Linum grandiflorum]